MVYVLVRRINVLLLAIRKSIVFPPCVQSSLISLLLRHFIYCYCPDATAFRSCRAPYLPASGADGEPIPFAFHAIGIRSHFTVIWSSLISSAAPTPTAPAPVTGHRVQGCSRARLVEEIPGGTGRTASAGPMARPRRRKSQCHQRQGFRLECLCRRQQQRPDQGLSQPVGRRRRGPEGRHRAGLDGAAQNLR